MQVFQSQGRQGCLRVCVDDEQVTCLMFKVNVRVSVSYVMCESHLASTDPLEVDWSGTVKRKDSNSNAKAPANEEGTDMSRIHRVRPGAGQGQEMAEDQPWKPDSTGSSTKPQCEWGSTMESMSGTTNVGGVNTLQPDWHREVRSDEMNEQVCSGAGDWGYGGDDDDSDGGAGACDDSVASMNSSEDIKDSLEESENYKQKETVMSEELHELDIEEINADTLQQTWPGTVGYCDVGSSSLEKIELVCEQNPSIIHNRIYHNELSVEERPRHTKDGLCIKGRQSKVRGRQNHLPNSLKCNLCQREVLYRNLLTADQRSQNTTQTCSICNLECKSKFYLNMHKHLRHSSSMTIKKRSCPMCCRPLTQQPLSSCPKSSGLVHPGLYQCSFCSAVYQNYQKFKLHLDYFNKHKKCQKETTGSPSVSIGTKTRQFCHIGIHTMKPLSVVLARLPRQKFNSLSCPHSATQQSPGAPKLISLTNLPIPKHKTSEINSPHESPKHLPHMTFQHSVPKHNVPHVSPKHNFLPSGRKPISIYNTDVTKRHWRQLLSKRPVNRMPVTKAMSLLTIKRSSDQLPITRPFNQMPIKRSSDQMSIERLSDQLLMKRPSDQLPTKRPSGQLPVKRLSDKLPMKGKCNEMPIKGPSEQMPIEGPSDQIPIKTPYNERPVKRLIDPKLTDKHSRLVPVKRQRLQPPPRSQSGLDQLNRHQDLGEPVLEKPFKRIRIGQVLARRGLNKSISEKRHHHPKRDLNDLILLKTRVRSLPNGHPTVQRLNVSGPSKKKFELEHCSIQSVPASQGSQNLRPLDVKPSPCARDFSWKKLWKCHFCEKVFRSEGSYINHKKTQRRSQMCTECGFTSKSKASYLIHQYQKHTNFSSNRYSYIVEGKDLHCHICEEPVAVNKVLEHIMSKHTGEKPYECCVCKEPSKDYDDWVCHGKSHLRFPEEKAKLQENKLMLYLSVKMNNPDKNDQVFCNLCKTYFSSEKEFVRHHKSKSKNKECGICKLTCHSEAGLMIHKYMSHGLSPGENNETSPADVPSGVNRSLSMWHEDDVANDNCEERKKCPFCLEMFPMKNLLSHVMDFHTQEWPYTCCSCKTPAVGLDQYIDHCDFHQGKKLFGRGTYQCLVCDSRFESRIGLTRHRKIVHKSKCLYCHLEFSSKVLLEVHLKNLHTKEMTPCRYCKKLFADLNLLAEHERNHFYSKLIPCPTCGVLVKILSDHMARCHSQPDCEFLCSLCGKRFTHKHGLQRHQQQYHGQSEKYQCDICKKTFKRASGFRKHALCHLNDRPFYQCQICGKKCSQRANLAVHMRIHASVKAFTCEHCGQGFNYNQSLQAHIRKKHTAHDSSIATIASTTNSTPSTANMPKVSSATQYVNTNHPRISVAGASYPELAECQDQSHEFYPDPSKSKFNSVSTFQQTYTNLINNLVPFEQDSSSHVNQQGFPMFFQQH